MSIGFVFAMLVGLMGIGIFIDSALDRSKKQNVELWVENFWLQLQDKNARELVRRSNEYFASIFDLIYGARVFSPRRIAMSTISSFFALTLVLLFIGVENTFAGAENTALVQWVYLILLGGIMNLVPDFVSVAETRFILGLAKRGISLPILFVVDLILTFMVFYGFALSLLFVFAVWNGQEVLEVLDRLSNVPRMNIMSSNMMGPFLYTTFATSLLWFGFLATVFLVRVLSIWIKPFVHILTELASSGSPGKTVSGLLSFIFVLIALAIQLVTLATS